MKRNPKAAIAAAVLILAGVLHPGCPALGMDELDAPETVTIDFLADLYKPVKFSHKRHTKLARCKDCHHHTTGQEDMDANCVRCHANSPPSAVVGCKDCHTNKQFSPEQVAATGNPNLYHIDKPGLKGAYHLNCIPCHAKKNAPSHCEGCHAFSDKGREYFHLQAKESAQGKAGKTHSSTPTK